MGDEAAPVECIGAIDQGTQSSRFFLYDKECNVIASHQVSLRQEYPRAGWVEQDPFEIIRTVKQAMAAAIEGAKQKHPGLVIRGLGITNQRETTIVWDKSTGKPLYNAIVWLDSRTTKICNEIMQKHGGRDAFRPVTGLPVSTYFSSYKLKWLLDNVPEVKEAIQERRCMFGTVDSWLLYNLTGGAKHGGCHITDTTNASRTNFMDIFTLRWHEEIVNTFGASKVIFPEIRSNSEVYGEVHESFMSEIRGVPIAGSLGDQQAAMLGQRCIEGEAKNTYGTGCFLLLHTGERAVISSHGLLTTLAYRLGDSAACYALEGAIAIAGQGITWLHDALEIIDDPSESESVAQSVPDSGGVYFVPAFSGLLAPWWEPDARGVILGLTQFSNKAHIVRAMLEAICYQTRDVVEAMKKDAEMEDFKCLYVDGGASRNTLLMQWQADVLQLCVVRPPNLETTSLGAAIAAGLALGFWSLEEVFVSMKKSQDATQFSPQIDTRAADVRYQKWKVAVERSIGLAQLAPDENDS